MSGPLFDGILETVATAPPATTREWWPVIFSEEFMPPGRSAPDAWLCRIGAGFGIGIENPPKGSEYLAPIPVAHGEIVEFSRCVSFGPHRITVDALGAWSCEPPAPPEVTHWYPADPADWCVDAGALARQLLDTEGPGEFTVEPCAWTQALAFRFEQCGSTGRFVPGATP